MTFSEEATALELIWLNSGLLEDIDDKNVKDYQQSSVEFDYRDTRFEVIFSLTELTKLDLLLNFLQQKGIYVINYSIDFLDAIMVEIEFVVPGQQPPLQLFAEIQANIVAKMKIKTISHS